MYYHKHFSHLKIQTNKGLCSIKLKLFHFIIIIGFICINLSAGDAVYVGNGEALLGNGITLEQAENIAFLMAKRDALDKFGVYVESKTTTENFQLTKDEVTAITGGIIKTKEGSKIVKKDFRNNELYIQVSSKFMIDTVKFKELIKKYIDKKGESDDNINKLIERVKKLESHLSALSKDKNVSITMANSAIDEVNNSYNDLSNSIISFAGASLYKNIFNVRLQRLKKIKQYLQEMQEILDPYKFYSLSIPEEPKIKDIGQGKIQIEVTGHTKLNKEYYQDALYKIKNMKMLYILMANQMN